jgi:hypothetical protein
VTAAEVVNPDLRVNSPTGTSVKLVEGDILTVDFDAVANQGVIVENTATITGAIVDVVSLTNVGDNFNGTWVSVEGDYDLVISVSDNQGGFVTKTISVVVTAPFINTTIVISSIEEGEVLLNPGELDIIAAINGLNGKTVTDLLFVLKNKETNAISPINGNINTMTMFWYSTLEADYVIHVVATLSDGSSVTSSKVNFSVDIETGVNTIEGVRDVTVYPNPFTDYVTVQIDAVQSQEAEVTVYNVIGTPIKTERIHVSNGANQLNIEASDWASGMYIVMIKSNGGVYSIKIEK